MCNSSNLLDSGQSRVSRYINFPELQQDGPYVPWIRLVITSLRPKLFPIFRTTFLYQENTLPRGDDDSAFLAKENSDFTLGFITVDFHRRLPSLENAFACDWTTFDERASELTGLRNVVFQVGFASWEPLSQFAEVISPFLVSLASMGELRYGLWVQKKKMWRRAYPNSDIILGMSRRRSPFKA